VFEDQLDQLKEAFQSISERVQESSLYITFYERYTGFSQRTQKLLIFLLGFLILFLLLSPPLAQYNTSTENISDFKNRKNITQKIIQQAKSGNSNIKTPKKILKMELDGKIRDFARSPKIKLTADQSKVSNGRGKSLKIDKAVQQNSYKVISKDLNSEQALNLAYSLKRLNSSLLVTKLVFSESLDKPGYFDNEIDVTNISLPALSSLLPKQQVETKKKSSRKKSTRGR